MKNLNLSTVTAMNSGKGLDIYLSIHGKPHYIVTRRSSRLLWNKLKGGVSLGELKRAKPSCCRDKQKFYRQTRYLLKILDDFIKCEYAA